MRPRIDVETSRGLFCTLVVEVGVPALLVVWRHGTDEIIGGSIAG